jgi:hypothetical protein
MSTTKEQLETAVQGLFDSRDSTNALAIQLAQEIARAEWGAGITLVLETSDQSYTTGFVLIDVVSTADGTTVSDFNSDDMDEDLEWALQCIDWEALPSNEIEVQ